LLRTAAQPNNPNFNPIDGIETTAAIGKMPEAFGKMLIKEKKDYISLTDIAKYRDSENSSQIIRLRQPLLALNS
jgi:hypothetical protein